jgi:amino acid transporter
MLFPFLSLLQVSSASSIVITWFIDLVTAGGRSFTCTQPPNQWYADMFQGLIDYIVMAITYIRFYAAAKAQGLDRKTLVGFPSNTKVT